MTTTKKQHYDDLLKQFSLSSDSEIVIMDEMTSKERSVVHDIARKYGLVSMSYIIDGTSNKYMKIKKTDDEKMDEAVIDKRAMKLFAHWSKVPFPVEMPEYLEHWLDRTDPYYDSRRLWQLFKEEMVKFGGRTKFSDYIDKIHKQMCEYVQTNKPLTEFKKKAIEITKDKETKAKKNNLYEKENRDKYFVSIDIKKANFTITCNECPEGYNGCKSWPDFVKSVTKCESEFILQSKVFRETIYGESGLLGICNRLYPKYTKQVTDLAKSVSNYKDMKFVSALCDEVLYQVDKSFDVKPLEELFNQKYPNMYHVEMFKLTKLGAKPYFVKEFVSGAKKIKCCPEKFIMQSIAFYEGKKVHDYDLLFVDEGCVAMYKQTLNF